MYADSTESILQAIGDIDLFLLYKMFKIIEASSNDSSGAASDRSAANTEEGRKNEAPFFSSLHNSESNPEIDESFTRPYDEFVGLFVQIDSMKALGGNKLSYPPPPNTSLPEWRTSSEWRKMAPTDETLWAASSLDFAKIISQLNGRPSVIKVGAPWCGPCKRGQAWIESAISNQHQSKNFGMSQKHIQFLGIEMPRDDDQELFAKDVTDFKKVSKRLSYPMVLISKETKEALGGMNKFSIPFYIYRDAEGEVTGYSVGAYPDPRLIERLLK